jgi:excisionase family DNA binding protein
MTEKIHTVEEIALMLRIPERTVFRELREGKMRGFKAGGAWRVPQSAIDEYIHGGSND